MKLKPFLACFIVTILFLCSTAFAQIANKNNSSVYKDLKSPETLQVLFKTNKGNFIIQSYRSWAPLAADRFYTLVKKGFYTNIFIFRVEKDYVVQFGISDNPKESSFWDKARLKDEPVLQKHKKGMVSFARSGINSRTTQLFVDMQNNAKLDTTIREGVRGYPPFGKVISGMHVFFQLNDQYAKRILPLQDSIYLYGNQYLVKHFPGLDKIISATIIR
ncbi:peptidylprolyl isomerase [Sediminibacterium sp.]|uniref:peptidylprolyl isomerase n=1 Tax=Sediminibacterium sp. TaxID=1917865 RepID=UPI002732AEC1|nr:peptidylprolyl isomerase [Sediminibacterium sp.]MDP3394666.1 peptidylprolyl isomerase [Sediminibacterium sp.]MDP3568501.1 peptidylprolyl isomerase [Sediminibacterium sp.]